MSNDVDHNIEKYFKENGIDYIGFDTEITIGYIEEYLKKYVVLAINMFLEDKNFNEILKK